MSYGMSRIDRLLSGSKTTSRSAENAAQYFLQGTEINQIGLFRSGLPIAGRNPRYKMIDVTITGSISDANYFSDVASASAAGLGQDAYEKIEGTLYSRGGYVIDGQIVTSGSNITNRVIDWYSNRGFTGAALDQKVEGWVRTVLKYRNERFNGKTTIHFGEGKLPHLLLPIIPKK